MSQTVFQSYISKRVGPALITRPDDFENYASFRNYPLTARLMQHSMKFERGDSIEFRAMTGDNGTAQTYSPGTAATVTIHDNTAKGRAHWRYLRGSASWTDAQVKGVEGTTNASALAQTYINQADETINEAVTSVINAVETKFVATASNSDMEAAGGLEPYSIFASVTSNGLAPSGFTTVHNINPTTIEGYQNAAVSYTVSSKFDQSAGILASFDTAYQLIEYRGLNGSMNKFLKNLNLSNVAALTNREGRSFYIEALRGQNDLSKVSVGDGAILRPVYGSAEVVAVDAFDRESTFTAGSPEYLWINFSKLKLVVRPGNMGGMLRSRLFNPEMDRPDLHTLWLMMDYNVVNVDRQAHCYVSAA